MSRIKGLAIPPAWSDVWICPWPNGHIQAVGIDAAGRRQYRYHDVWRKHRDREKFERALQFAERLPDLRSMAHADLRRNDLSRTNVLGAVVRLLDLGAFRIGGREYAEVNETYGLVSLRREHVHVRRDVLLFEYPAKCSLERVFETRDADIARVVHRLKRRRSNDLQLFAFKGGEGWQLLRTEDVNNHIKESCGGEYSAKDFRNWSATVLAAALFADSPSPTSIRQRRRLLSQVVTRVAEQLGNTPAVCRSSYIDPRVIDRYLSGTVIDTGLAASILGRHPTRSAREAVEAAVIELLADGGRRSLAAA